MSTVTVKTEGSFAYIPLLLIFSIREKIRDILSVGLFQCHFRITQAQNSHIASLKASQFAPDLIIADITDDNTKDILLVNRLQCSDRTKNTPLLAIVPRVLKEKLEKILQIKTDREGTQENRMIYFIEYPFSFSDLLNKIKTILSQFGKAHMYDQQGSALDRQINALIAKRLFDNTIPTDHKLREIAGILHRQWVFPFTVTKALDIIDSETSCCTELSDCIKSDLSASAAILKVANTVQYAKRHSRITEVKEAVVRIGFHETRNLLSCFALIDLSHAIYTQSGFTRTEFWLHSLAVAHIATELCVNCSYRRPELAFVAGLLHDLGKIPLDNNFENVFPQLLEETTTKITSFHNTEHRFMNFSHAELGHFLTTEWNFPSSITLAILNHHNPSAILTASPVIDRILFEAVFVANQIAKAMDLGHSCDEIVEEIPLQMLKELNLPKGPTDRFLATIIRNINQMAKFLNIPLKRLTVSQPVSESEETRILFVHGSHAEFHPLILALRHKGYTVTAVKKILKEQQDPSVRVIITLPEPGAPLDIMLYDEDQKCGDEHATLKIFIMDTSQNKSPVQCFKDANMIFINQQQLDIRYITYELDKFFGKVIVPRQADVEPIREDAVETND